VTTEADGNLTGDVDPTTMTFAALASDMDMDMEQEGLAFAKIETKL
jgi:hypothetical protein